MTCYITSVGGVNINQKLPRGMGHSRWK